MIRYELACQAGHEFEGWFGGSAAFAEQVARGWVICPQCGTADVHQMLAAPAVVTRAAARPEQAHPKDTPEQLVRQALREIRTAVERHCDDMGDGFVDEALRIDRGEAPERGIYGRTDEKGRERLEDAGVAFASIPWVPDHDA